MKKQKKSKKKERTEKISLKKSIILVILAVIIAIGATMIIFSLNKMKDVVLVREYNIYLNVDNYAGFDVGTERLTFGTVPGGSVGKRKINFSNNLSEPLKVKFEVYGKHIKEWLWTPEQEFVLNPEELKVVYFEIKPPYEAEKRNYTGKLVAYFYKV